MVQEITVLSDSVINENTALRNSLAMETKVLRDSIMLMKEDIKDLKSQMSESNSRSYLKLGWKFRAITEIIMVRKAQDISMFSIFYNQLLMVVIYQYFT
jgi:hypothetical protein